MARIVLVMHEPLGAAFARCAEHVLGTQPELCVFDVPPDGDVAKLAHQLGQVLLQAPPSGSLVLCDLYGATPFNVARRAINEVHSHGSRACLLTGANLNMVLKALTDRLADPQALCDSVRRGGVRGIVGSDHAG